MGQEIGQSDDVAGEWTDTARYRALITVDRRHWAWLWLKRNHNYQAAARRVAETTSWQILGLAAHRLIRDDLNILFLAGYMFISRARAIASGMPGFFGTRISIHPSLLQKPSPYPWRMPMPLTSLVSATRSPSFWMTRATNSR